MAISLHLSPALSLASLALTAYTLRRLRDTEQDIVRTHQTIADHVKTQTVHSNAIRAISTLQQLERFRVDILAARDRITVHPAPEPIDPNDVIAEAQRIVKGGGS